MASTTYPSRRKASCTPAQSPCSSSTTRILTFDLSIRFAICHWLLAIPAAPPPRYVRLWFSKATASSPPPRRKPRFEPPDSHRAPSQSVARSKDRRQLLRRNARSVVAHSDGNPPVRHIRGDFDPTLSFHGLDGIDNQIHQC